jgi:hypothetical protein
MHVCVAGRREIAEFRVIRPFTVFNPVDQLGDDAVQIHVALTVGIGRHVHRHAVDPGREIRPVIEVETAQKILVGLAGPAVLRRHHARHDFNQFADTQQWPILELVLAHDTLRCRRRNSDEVGFAPQNLDRFQTRRLFRRTRRFHFLFLIDGRVDSGAAGESVGHRTDSRFPFRRGAGGSGRHCGRFGTRRSNRRRGFRCRGLEIFRSCV